MKQKQERASEEIERLPKPPCLIEMMGEILEYQPGENRLICTFPVQDKYANPMQTMQGGFIAAAFDNVFGPLSLLAGGKPSTTVSMQLTYHRPVLMGDKLIIAARAVKKGKRTLYMEAEGFNSQGDLVASANSTWMYV